MPRKTSRSIRDDLPTQAALLEAGTSFDAQRWNEPRYASIEAGIAALGLAHEQFIKRADVFKLVNNDPRLAVMLTLVWGYRDGTINGHRPPIEAVFRNAEMIANVLQKLRQQAEPLPAGVLIGELNALCGTGISTSTTSKLAYFFELKTLEGPCVIYDYKVINTIMEGTYQEFLRLRRLLPVERLRKSRDPAVRFENARNQQTQTYAAYIRTVDAVAKRLGGAITADQVELALFRNSPGKEVLAARTRSSKQIQERNERRRLSRALKNIDATDPQAA